MSMALIITALTLLLTIVLLIRNRIPLSAVGLLIISILTISGVISSKQAFARLSDHSVILVVGVFIIGKAFFKAGLTDKIGAQLVKMTVKFKHMQSVVIFCIMLIAAALSSVLSSLGVQVALMSLVLSLAEALNLNKSRALLGLAYASSIGGMMTLLGTPLNLVGKAAYEAAMPGESIGIFDISYLGVPIGLTCIAVFAFVTSRFLPERSDALPSDVIDFGKKGAQNESHRKQGITMAVFIGFILLVALDGKTSIPANIAAVLAILVLGAAHVMEPEEMFACVKWDVIIFVVGMLTLSDAVSAVGIGEILAVFLQEHLSGLDDPMIIMMAMVVVLLVLTQVMGNSGAFGIVLPIAVAIAQGMEIELKPMIMALTFAASCAFVTPLATQSYPMIAAEGKLKFSDWVIQGMPMVIISFVGIWLIVPYVWPL